jgi:DNA-binding NtrC family response regulator
MKILVVDDEKIKRVTLSDELAGRGHAVSGADDGQQAWDMLQSEAFDVVVTDLKMPRIDGMQLLTLIKESDYRDVDVVMMSAYGSIPVAVEAVKRGAFDFITKPFRNEEVLPLIERIERKREPEVAAEAADTSEIDASIIGQTEGMSRVKQMIHICARTDANVLLFGETGVGKDLIASTIHKHSHRREFPFAKVGCALFSPALIESELYGHERGAFTGAETQRHGRFDVAEKGSLYLDDVDDIELSQQAKLLRAIEEKVFERVGGTQLIRADVRVIASTKQNLLEKINDNSFRQDLYYRLDVLRINIPPLRERTDDIPLLVDHLLRRIAPDQECLIEDKAMDVLKLHHWPGNVRELYHTLERAFLIGSGRITASLLKTEMGGILASSSPNGLPKFTGLPQGGFHAAMEHAEKQLLMNALESSSGNKTAAANALGMRPSTFRDKLTKYGLG